MSKKKFKPISINEEFHKILKEVSKKQGISMSKLIENAVRNYNYKEKMGNVFIYFSTNEKEVHGIDYYNLFFSEGIISESLNTIVVNEIIANANNEKLFILKSPNASTTVKIHEYNKFILIEVPISRISAKSIPIYTNNGEHIYYSGEAVYHKGKAVYNKSFYLSQIQKQDFYDNGMPKLNQSGMPLHKTGKPMKRTDKEFKVYKNAIFMKYDKNNNEVYETGKPMYDKMGMPLYKTGKPMYNEKGKQIYINDKKMYDDEGVPLYSTGYPLYNEVGMPLYETGLPMYSDKGEVLNKKANIIEYEDDGVTPIYNKAIYKLQNTLGKIRSFNDKLKSTIDKNDNSISLLLEEFSLEEVRNEFKLKQSHFIKLEKEFIDNPDALEELKIDLLAQEKGIPEYLSYQDKVEELKGIIKK